MAFVSAEDEGGEGCDVIVDDVSQGFEPGFRDGVISEAVNEVVAGGSLYFSSAGNCRNGYKFTSVSLLTVHRPASENNVHSLGGSIMTLCLAC